jgi:hypothetical protein
MLIPRLEDGMAEDTQQVLAQIEAGQEAIHDAVAAQGETLRLILERLGLILERLTPDAGDGPTLTDLLTELVGRVGENWAMLRRIDMRTQGMASDVAAEVIRAITTASGVNGVGAAGDGEGGSTRA